MSVALLSDDTEQLAFDPAGLEAVRALGRAKTIGEVLQLNFPIMIGELRDQESLSSFDGQSGDAGLLTQASISQNGNWYAKGEPVQCLENPMAPAFREASKIITEHRRVSTPTQRWHINFSGYLNHVAGGIWHYDDLDARELNYTVSDNRGTLIVPHLILYDLLKNSSFADLLDASAKDFAHHDDEKFDWLNYNLSSMHRQEGDELYDECISIHAAMVARAVRVPDYTIACFTGITPHKRPLNVQGDRKILIAHSDLH